jgi:Glycosyltransferases, probably involved in cell wall biogenesis
MDYKATPIQQPTRHEKRVLRLMICAGVFSMGFFLYTLLGNEHDDHSVLYVLLLITIFYNCLKYLHEWYHYFSISVPETKPATRTYTVDIFTTFCPGEPYEMLEKTLTAIQNVRYPHTAWCCDEANDPYVIALCEKLQVKHVTRNNRLHAKAGNINNALRQATGELCVILDPDHIPAPCLLDDIVPLFDDPQIGFVQIVQAYYNHYDNLVAKGAAQQTYQFYGPMMMSMHAYGTVQAIGANCTFRRAALDSIGGHAPGLAEDMNTAMHLHAHGWKSAYLPVVLTRGLVPASLAAYYKQQLKWSRGTFELLVTTFPRFFTRFTWRQRLHYCTRPFHYFSGVIFLINWLIPVAALFTGAIPLHMDMVNFLLAIAPLLCMTVLIRHYVQKWVAEEGERGFHVVCGLLQIGTWWVHTTGLVYTLLRKKVPYLPTPKDDTDPTPLSLHIPNLLVVVVSLAAIVYGLRYDYNPFSLFMAALAGLNIFFMLFIFYASRTSRQKAISQTIQRRIKRRLWLFRHKVYAGVRRYALLLSIVVMAVAVYVYRKQLQLPVYLPETTPVHQASLHGRMPPPLKLNHTQPFTKRILPASIKAVVYDKGYHWFRNKHALLREEVEDDLAAMKELSINTVVRTVPGIYDKTLFRCTRENGMNMIARLWMSTRPEYVMDSVAMKKEMERLLDVVRSYRHEKNIIAWNLGNDVLYTLSNRFHIPDYFYCRNMYMQWLSEFCQAIRQLDPVRPITMDICWNKGGKYRLAFLEQYLPEVDYYSLIADSANRRLLQEPIPAHAFWGEVPVQCWNLQPPMILPAWQDIANKDFISLKGILDLEGRKKPGYDTVALYWANRQPAAMELPDIKILKPAKITYEYKPLVYHVLVRHKEGWQFAGDSLQLHWYLIRTDHNGTTLYMKKAGEGPFISLMVPNHPEQYRLYVQLVADNRVKEAASTLNIPLE